MSFPSNPKVGDRVAIPGCEPETAPNGWRCDGAYCVVGSEEYGRTFEYIGEPLSAQVKALEAERDELRDELKHEVNVTATQKAQIERQRATLRQKDRIIQDLGAARHNQCEENKRLDTELTCAKASIDTLRARLNQRPRPSLNQATRIEWLEGVVESLRAQIRERDGIIVDLRARLRMEQIFGKGGGR